MRFSAFVAVLGACLMWGTTGNVASGMTASVSPLATGAFTMGVGGLLLALFTLGGVRKTLRNKQNLPWIVAGGLAVFVYPLAFYTSMHDAGVAVGNSISIGAGPLFAGLIEWVTRGRRPTLLWVVSLGVAVLGLTLVGVARGGDGPAALQGVFLAILAGFGYALYSVSGNRLIEAGGNFAGSMGAVFGAGAIPLLVVLGMNGLPIFTETDNLLRGLYLALGPLVLGYLLFGFALTKASVQTVTLVSLLEPVIATTLAVLLLNETLPGYGWLGIALLIVGVAIAAFEKRK